MLFENEVSYQNDMNVPLTPIRCLYRGVDLYGKKVGIVSGERRYTYAQFGERCERLAAGLLSEGIRRGDRIAYLSFNNNQLLEGYYGVPLIRAIVMPLNVRLTPAELIEILNHCRRSHAGLRDRFLAADRRVSKGVSQSSSGTSRSTTPSRRRTSATKNC